MIPTIIWCVIVLSKDILIRVGIKWHKLIVVYLRIYSLILVHKLKCVKAQNDIKNLGKQDANIHEDRCYDSINVFKKDI